MWNLIIYDLQGLETLRKPVEAAPLVVGRDKACGIVLDSKAVSRQHARIVLEGDTPVVIDEGSANGTFVNGMLIEHRANLKDGDEIGVGQFKIVVRGSGAHSAQKAKAPESAAADMLDAQLQAIRSFRVESQSSSVKKSAVIDEQWAKVVPAMRTLQQKLAGDKRVLTFTIRPDGREVAVKVADSDSRLGHRSIVLTRDHPDQEYRAMLKIWLLEFGEHDAGFDDGEDAMRRFLQRLALSLA